jgi:phosphohistidine phosphatase
VIVTVRRVTLVRHAHAEWPQYSGRDLNRPLTPRGMKEALATAQAIKAAGHRPDLLLASPAKRTRQTAAIIAEELVLPDSALQYVDTIYNASAATLEEIVRHAIAGHVLLVAHNPGITELARQLAVNPELPSLVPAQWLHIHIPGV